MGAQLGHRIVRPVPALTPIQSPDLWVRRLLGVTLPDAVLTVVDRRLGSVADSIAKDAILDVRRGSLLLTHFGLSGPAAMDLSRAVARSAHVRDLVLVANFTPEQPYEESLRRLREEVHRDGKRLISSVLVERVPRRLALTLLELAHIDPTRRLAELSKRQLGRICASLTRCPINVSGTVGFRKAEVTSGGVELNEVHSKTMESKRVPRCFFAGEVLDIDGPIGGYNFQAAFSTGWLAGSSVGTHVGKE